MEKTYEFVVPVSSRFNISECYISKIYVVKEAFDTDLYFSSDSSKQSYGFALYNVQDNKSNLMFAKAKVTPIKPRGSPTLKLLLVFLGVKCMHLILDSYPNVTFKRLVIAVDAQVVLSWLMSQQIKTIR